MATKKMEVRALVDEDVVVAMRKYGQEQNPVRPWSLSQIIARILTKEFTGREWEDRRYRRQEQEVSEPTGGNLNG